MTREFKNFLLLLAISLFLMLGLGPHFGWAGAIGLFLMIADLFYVLFSLFSFKKPYAKETMLPLQQINKKKNRKWLWIVGGIVLFVILILIIGGDEKKIGPAQVYQPITKKEEKIPLNQKIKIVSIKKGFLPADFYAGRIQDFIIFEITFENKTEKDIKGAKGILTFFDIFDEKITSLEVRYDKGIKKNSQKIWEAQIEFNPFIEDDIRLKNVKEFKYRWEPAMIIYEDGTIEE